MTVHEPVLSNSQGVGIDIRNVNVFYGDNHVLKDISLSVAPGEFFAFLGPSGCGKSTLLRLIAGFSQLRSGEVRLGGEDIAALPPWQRDVGMLFQSYALWPHMTVARNVAFGLEERRLPRATIVEKVRTALALVGLAELAERYPAQLSGGQQQRVALARTIAVEPKVLLLDEPLSNLDAKLRVQVRRELRDLQQRLRVTTIFVTHDQEEANSICDRIAVINEGVVQQVGTPMHLYEQPANLFVAGFLGAANVLEGRLVADGSEQAFVLANGGRLPMPAATSAPDGARLVFRPQQAVLGEPGGHGLVGAIRHREFLGATVRYGVGIGSDEILVDAPFTGPLHEIGAPVSVGLTTRQPLFLSK
jgi:iron(III) transport system ATP-binding protein